jgi:hypothetical protein
VPGLGVIAPPWTRPERLTVLGRVGGQDRAEWNVEVGRRCRMRGRRRPGRPTPVGSGALASSGLRLGRHPEVVAGIRATRRIRAGRADVGHARIAGVMQVGATRIRRTPNGERLVVRPWSDAAPAGFRVSNSYARKPAETDQTNRQATGRGEPFRTSSNSFTHLSRLHQPRMSADQHTQNWHPPPNAYHNPVTETLIHTANPRSVAIPDCEFILGLRRQRKRR